MSPPTAPTWTLLTNHAHVLVCLHRDPEVRIRDIADRVGITERAVQRILTDLEEAGFVKSHREGRRNRYELHLDRPMRHPLESHHAVASLIASVGAGPEAPRPSTGPGERR